MGTHVLVLVTEAERQESGRSVPTLFVPAGLGNMRKGLATVVSGDSAVMAKARCLNCCSYRNLCVLCWVCKVLVGS